MRYLSDRAFVIKRFNYGDSDRYITLFTKNGGKVEVVARGVRKITSRRAASLELLNLINFHAVKSSRNYVLTETSLINSNSVLKRDLENIKRAFLMCELVDAVLPYGMVQSEVFNLMERAVVKIREDSKNISYFQAKLLMILGFWDGRHAFKNEDHLKNVTEQVIERRLKTREAFKTYTSNTNY